MNIAEILAAHARARPNASAIVDTYRGRDRVTTFAQLDRAAARAAQLLWDQGLRPGDAVLVFQPMSAELYAALLAIFRLRLVAMFLDPSAGREHVERCCQLQAPRGFIGSTKAHLLRLWSPALRRIPIKLVIGLPLPGAVRWSRSDHTPPHPGALPCAPDTPALLTFTSGSTGQPKAVVRSHGFLLAQHAALVDSLTLTAGAVDLTTLPIVLLANLGSGVTSLIPNADLRYPGAIDPLPVLGQIERHRPVSSAASPAFFERLARTAAPHRLQLPCFRKLFSGGAPVFPRTLDQMHAMAPRAEVIAVYGSTEAEPIAHVARSEWQPADRGAMLAGRGLLAGHPVATIRVRILRDQWGAPAGPYTDASFAAERVKHGEAGEIVVSGAHVLAGYLHGHGDVETKFRVDGTVWHRTGDAGYLDESGRLWLLGRCAARIDDAHGSVHPFAVETAVHEDPRIKRAALVAHRGRRSLAVEFFDEVTDTDVSRLRQSLGWAHIDAVRVLAEVPVDPRHNAKIDYPRLRSLLNA